MAIGPVPGWVILVLVLLLYTAALALAIRAGHDRAAIDEVRGLDQTPEAWKT